MDVPCDHAAPTARYRCGDARPRHRKLEIVESYPDDKYLPSFLLRGEVDGVVFHAHIATEVEGHNVRVVTMYRPGGKEWEDGFRRRTTK